MRALALVAIFALAAGNAAAQALRCESPDGKVAYAQATCPAGSAPVRAVGASAPPTAEDQRAAATRARSDAKTLDRIERERKAEEARAARAQATDSTRAAAHARTCRRLALRVMQAKDDLAAASLSRTKDVRRRLQKAQENYDLECAAAR